MNLKWPKLFRFTPVFLIFSSTCTKTCNITDKTSDWRRQNAASTHLLIGSQWLWVLGIVAFALNAEQKELGADTA